MNLRSGIPVADPAPQAQSPPASYAGRPRDAQLEYKAILANASIGIAFTRDRKFFLCNPKFTEMFGWRADELIGQAGEIVYPSRESYEALGAIAIPVLGAGGQLDLEWEVKRKDGSTFLAHIVAKAINPADTRQGTVWIVEDATEKERRADQLARLLREQEAILNTASIGICFVKDRHIVRCTRRFEQMHGYGPGELAGRPTSILYADDAGYRTIGEIYAKLGSGQPQTAEVATLRKDGTVYWSRITGSSVDPSDPALGTVWLDEDITEQKRAGDELQRVLAEQQALANNVVVGIAFVRERKVARCNRRFEELFGYTSGEMLGKSTEIFFPDHAAFEAAGGEIYPQLAEGKTFTAEWLLKRKDETTFWCKLVGKAIDPARPDDGSIWIYDDINAERAARESLEAAREALERAVAERTAELRAANRRLEAEIADRKEAESRAQHLADHDPLTALPNRRLLEDRLTQSLALSQRNRKQTAVMFVDLDRFKAINDSLGHAAGDLLLKEVAGRLVGQLREVDTICRIGGDEFVVVLPEVKRSSDAANVAQKIIETVSQPVVIEERELQITPSIGISVFPDDGRDAETLIRNADAAMYHAKETGRAAYQFFTEQMNQAASRRLALENDLRRAVQKGEMRVFYQPIIDARSGRAVAHEALVRWQHPTRGVVTPPDFLQLAEDTGLILRIGEWVLREACRWVNFIGTDHGLPVSVNLSTRQFSDPKLVELVARVLKDSGLPPRLLELEITESTLMHNADHTLATLRKLKKLGVSLAVADFGSGHSSLAYLRRFAVDKLKIDRAFMAETQGAGDHKAIIAGIIGLAHTLGPKVVAVGVETEAQKEFLRSCHCDYLQGYLTGRPVDADTASKEYV